MIVLPNAGRCVPKNLANLAGHPALSALLSGVVLCDGEAGTRFGLAVTGAGSLILSSTLDKRPGALVLLRFGLELAWLRHIDGLGAAAAVLLAARAAGGFLGLLPNTERDAALEDPAVPLFARLAGDAVLPIAQLTACWRLLAEASADRDDAPDLQDFRVVERLWSLAIPTEAMLVHGGDDRLTLDPATARNRYLCQPWPQPEVISFASCTASAISVDAFAAAERVRQDLLAAAMTCPVDSVLARASDQITAELLVHCGAEDIAEAVLSASGTDATLLLTGLLAAEHPRDTITTILMSPGETGSGVPEAVQGRHFAPCTASGVAVEKGGRVDGFPPGLSMVTVALRTDDGLPRDEAVIAAECEAAIEAALARGRVVLHAIDGSKTGLAAPQLLALDLLAARFEGRLDIVVDACQFRIEPERLRGYLERGWPVLVTGSKFFGAPGFCGAVLFPRARLRRIAGAGRLPDGLGAYANLSDGNVSRRCPGLLLRWTAALTHMRPFGAMPADSVRRAIDTAGGYVRAAIMRQAHLHLIPAPRPDATFGHAGWSHRPSVFTFAIRKSDTFMSAPALRPLYLALAAAGQAPACYLGQPVQLGAAGLGGLRVALSAAQICSGEDVRARLAMVLDNLNCLLAD
jgi:hypothetical protein